MKLIDFTNADVCRIVRTTVNEYNEPSILDEDAKIPCLFRFGLSSNQNNYVDNIGTDAHCYLDTTNDFVKRNETRLEGLYLSFKRYGEDPIWYKIARCIVGRTLLLDNEDNCIHVFLQKIVDPGFPDPPEEPTWDYESS